MLAFLVSRISMCIESCHGSDLGMMLINVTLMHSIPCQDCVSHESIRALISVL